MQQESSPAHFTPFPLVISPRTTVASGGVGTFDELWEGVAEVSLGFRDVPIVCVNVNGYYDSFQQMLERAFADKLIYRPPNDLLGIEPTASVCVCDCMLLRCNAHRVSGTSSPSLCNISPSLYKVCPGVSSSVCLPRTLTRIHNAHHVGTHAGCRYVCVRDGMNTFVE